MSYGVSIGTLPLFVMEKDEIGVGDGSFELKDLSTDAGNAMDGLFFGRMMGTDSIFGNRIPWRKRAFFRSKSGLWGLRGNR